jgi:hypothetical protein
MRSTIWMLMAAGVLTIPAVAPAAGRENDSDWCRDGDWGGRQARHCEVREVALSPRGAVEVSARPNGGIRAYGWDRSETRLQVKIEATADSEAEAKALASQVKVETDGTIRATGPENRGGDRRWWASFRLDVPRQTDLRLDADNGGITIEGVSGHAEFQTMNGGIHLKGVGGNVHGRTTNGGLHVELLGSEWDGEGLDLRTTNGGVHLELPADYNARLETGTVNGRVHTDLPVSGQRRGQVGGQIEADLGHGGRLLRLQTTNGGVHIGQD